MCQIKIFMCNVVGWKIAFLRVYEKKNKYSVKLNEQSESSGKSEEIYNN